MVSTLLYANMMLSGRPTLPLRSQTLRVQAAAPRRTVTCAHVANAAAVATKQESRLGFVEQAPPDPILGVSEAFKRDTSDDRLNLGVGAYRTNDLKPYVLNVVKKAEKIMIDSEENKEYLPIQGLEAFNKATAQLLLGEGHPAIKEERVATLQSLSGTGSLRVGAEFISKFLPGRTVYLSNPTWGNHKNIFTDAGVEWKVYRYFDKATVGLAFEGMLEDLKSAPEGSIVVLHGCAHNPTGVDPTREQWGAIADVVEQRGHMPFFDVAYQGFASGSLDDDAWAPRFFAERGIEMMVAQSYSKNLGLYAERVGAINYVLADAGAAKRVLSQNKRIARALYSNPPVHGARIASIVVGRPELFAEWNEEMGMMAGRIRDVRQTLYDELVKLNPDKDWSFVTRQIGMFSFTGLSPPQVRPFQVENMTQKHHVYMTKDGRISLAGLPSNKAANLANAIVDSFKV